MKLHFLDPKSRTAINVARLRKCEYNIRRIIVEGVKILDALILICNGTPDDMVLGILSYHIDGDKVVGVVKPEKKRHLGALDQLKTYLSPKIQKFMIIIDQEDLTLDKLFDETLNRMERIGINVSNIEEMDRLKVFQSSLAGKRFEVIIVVNGLEEVCTKNHTIEDHLTKAAGIDVTENSKQSWNSLSQNERKDIFRGLKGKTKVIEELFPQQVSGCKRLKME